MKILLRSELQQLKERQAQLHDAIAQLDVRFDALEKKIAEEENSAAKTPMAVPPVLAAIEGVKLEAGNVQRPTSNAQFSTEPDFKTPQVVDAAQPATVPPAAPPPLPPVAYKPFSETAGVAQASKPAVSQISQPAWVNIPERPELQRSAGLETGDTAGSKSRATPGKPPGQPESFEMRLGTYWLVRIGIVAMLTALVFFASYAYQNYIGRIGPAGKVTLLYLASGALLGFGAWFQRKTAKESLRNYAQVLLAGGMAAVYFTTYAAHHFPNLQVITSETVDGVLLLMWAAVMAWTADRKKSEVFALFAVGLAFYSSAITRVGYFTLYSNLVLAAAALFFLVRNQWAKLSFGCLIATYASYGFWRFYSNDGWAWAGPTANANLWTGVGFLGAYWLVFTAAVFLSKNRSADVPSALGSRTRKAGEDAGAPPAPLQSEPDSGGGVPPDRLETSSTTGGITGVSRASFITLNNAAFYVLFLLTMFQVQSGGFWKFNLITGAVLLGVAALAKVRLRDEPLAANTYLTHGLLLVTVGIIAKFNHDHSMLALALCLESVVLWMTGTLRKNIIMRTSACVSAAMATLWALDGIGRDSTSGAWLGAGVGGLLTFNAFWAHKREQRNSPRLMRVSPSYFSALALFVWTFAISQNVAKADKPAAYALLALVLVASVHLLRLRELSLLGQLLLPLAAFHFMGNQAHGLAEPEPAWVFACVGGVALALVHWWQKQTEIESPRTLRVVGQFVPALILVGVTTSWLQPKLDVTQWLLANSALLLALTAYGAATRNWVLALVAQVFAGIAVANFLLHAGDELRLTWLSALAPLAALTVLSAAGRWRANSVAAQASSLSSGAGVADASPDRRDAWPTIKTIAMWYGRLVMALLVWWTIAYVANRELVWSFTALGVVAFAIAGWRRSRDFLAFATVLNVCALCSLVFQLMSGTTIYALNFVAVFVWMIEQQLARRQAGRFPVPAMAHNLAMSGAGVALWWLTSAWVREDFSNLYLTAGWSVFAFVVLGVGIALRERVYRWLGLTVLGCALGRVVIFDVWRLETIYRILSFFALGAVLLVLGFIYSKYQDRLRQWL